MKSTVHFSISSSAKVLVNIGENVSKDTVLIEDKLLASRKIIPLGQLLNIKPETIHRYLKKKIGEDVLPGETLAVVRSFFSSKIVKSPVFGKITEIDLTKGTLTLTSKEEAGKEKIKSQVNGRVKNITRTVLELEVEGEVFGILYGKGEDVTGRLVLAPKESLGILDDLEGEMEESIIASQKIHQDVIVKLEVMGVKGLITAEEIGKSELPWVKVGKEIFKKLAEFSGKTVWLRPLVKQLVIID